VRRGRGWVKSSWLSEQLDEYSQKVAPTPLRDRAETSVVVLVSVFVVLAHGTTTVVDIIEKVLTLLSVLQGFAQFVEVLLDLWRYWC